jgi:hypothetical protein
MGSVGGAPLPLTTILFSLLIHGYFIIKDDITIILLLGVSLTEVLLLFAGWNMCVSQASLDMNSE